MVWLQLAAICFSLGLNLGRGWGLTDAAQTGNFPICKLTLGRKRNHSVMVERGGRKRDGKGWKGVGGTEEVEEEEVS